MISSLFYKDPKLNKLFIHNYMNNSFGIYSKNLHSSNIINKITIKNEVTSIINQILDKIDYEYYYSDSSNETFSKTLFSEDELEYTNDNFYNNLTPTNSSYFSDDGFEIIYASEIEDSIIYDSDSDSSVDSVNGIPRCAFVRVGNYLYENAINYKN